MKIIHVATLVTPEGSFAGPVRVATNHVRELRRKGHDAILVAAASGFASLPSEIDGVPAKLFRSFKLAPLGYSGLVAPGLYLWLIANMWRAQVAQIHLARDLITLPSAIIALALRRVRRGPVVCLQ